MNALRRILNFLKSLFVRKTRWFDFSWGIPTDEHAALRKLFPTLKGSFRKPDGTKHPLPVRYIRHRRRAGSPYRRTRVAAA